MQERYFDTGAVNLHFMEGRTEGVPLLLIHPLFSKWREFAVLTPGLGKIARVFALDLRGHGQSGRADSYRVESFVPDLATFIKGYVGQPAVVFGHSLGGMLALMLGAVHPDLVTALVIGEAIISRKLLEEFSRASRPKISWWREIAKLGSPELIAEELRNELVPAPPKNKLVPARQLLGDNNPSFNFFAECLSQLDPAVLTANIDAWDDTYAAYRPEELFPRIRCPVLLLQGKRELGGLMPDRDVEQALRQLPDGRRVRIERAGHYLHLEDREAVLRAVVEFLGSLPGQAEG